MAEIEPVPAVLLRPIRAPLPAWDWPGDVRPLWLRALERRLPIQRVQCDGCVASGRRCRQRAWFLNARGEPRCGQHRTQGER